MSSSPNDSSNRSQIARTSLLVYALELAIAAAAVGAYKGYGTHSTIASAHSILMFGGVVASLVLAAWLTQQLRHSPRTTVIAIASSFLSTALAFAFAEVAARLLTRTADGAVSVGGVPLRPTWPEVVDRARGLLGANGGDTKQTYFVYDPDLGWVVGRSRRSSDGRYSSSVEGIRSATPGIAFADLPPLDRIALIGDSNAFSFEVPFEESLGHFLEARLGQVQVLNFGVDGYGIDQTYLRYLRDVRPWRPKVVVVVFIQHDLMRTMAVYPFVSFGWSGYLVKPRFDVEDGRLQVVNLPLPSPDAIFSAPAPSRLPFVDYDPGFVNTDWDWRFEHGPRLLRLVTSISPPWPKRQPAGHASVVDLNARILSELVSTVARDGATPLLVYLPQWIGDDATARRTLAQTKLKYLDMTDCVMQVPEPERRVPSGHHYAAAGNRAIAQCLAPEVSCALDVQSGADCSRQN